MPAEIKAPGLVFRARSDGTARAYWAAPAGLVKRGYRPAMVRLRGSDDDILARCAVLQANALEWASQPVDRRDPMRLYDGTFASLIRAYQIDPDSPYRELRPKTIHHYDTRLRMWGKIVGARRIAAVTGADVRKWHRKLLEACAVSTASVAIGVLRAVISYGASLGLAECVSLREQVRAVRFAGAPPREAEITYEQVRALRKAAHAAGLPSMALGLTLQYELALRPCDVIGEWVWGPAGGGIRRGGRTWSNGLLWSDIGPDGVLRKRTTKTGAIAVHRVADYPDLAAELERVPAGRRIGPMVVSEVTGRPYTDHAYRVTFRRLARAAGLPEGLQCRDARAGAVTEAYEAGVEPQDAMVLATHSSRQVSQRYNRTRVEQSSRAARARVKSRENKP